MPPTRAVTRNLRRLIDRGAGPQDPFHRLPDEIIVTILSLCLPDYSDWPNVILTMAELADEMPALSPVAMTHVCSTWRDLVLRTKTLWTCPFVVMGEVEKDDPSANELKFASFKCLQVAMERSHPLPVRPFLTYTETPGKKAYWLRVINFLVKHNERIQSLSLHLTPSGAVASLLAADASFPVLEELYIMSLEHAPNDLWRPEGILSAPQLKTVTFKVPGFHLPPSAPFLQTVVRFSIANGYEYIFRMMQSAPCLEELYMLPFDSGEGLSPQVESFTHARLKVLSIWSPDSIQTMLDRATLPALTSLSIIMTEDRGSWSAPSFAGFVARSRCALTALRLDGLVLKTAELIEALKLVPALTDLSITEPPYLTRSYVNGPFFLMLAVPALVDRRLKMKWLPEIRNVELYNAQPVERKAVETFYDVRVKIGHPIRVTVALIKGEEEEGMLVLPDDIDQEGQLGEQVVEDQEEEESNEEVESDEDAEGEDEEGPGRPNGFYDPMRRYHSPTDDF